jgi:cyclopropane fatty-acyl-phospholipid synthase-like methyltransferase
MSQFENPQQTWEKRFATEDYIFGVTPNHYLLTQAEYLKSGNALAIADGEGRNGVWLAKQGFRVDSFDFVQNAIDKANQLALKNGVSINAVCSDWVTFDWGKERYDNIVGIFFQFADAIERGEIFVKIDRALKPGGTLIIQGYSHEQLIYKTGGPGKLENLYTEEILAKGFKNYEVLDSRTYTEVIEEGRAHNGMSGLVGFTARKSLI